MRSELDGSNLTLVGIRDLYLGGLAYNDDQVASLMNALESRYPAGEVLVTITSDHGEELFEHADVLHGYTLYNEQLRAPLVLWWPDRLAPRTVTAETTTIDVHHAVRTLVERSTSDNGLWARILGSEASAAREPVRFAASPGAGGLFMARSTDHKLIWAPRTGKRWGMGRGAARSHDPEYFFDLQLDPGETTNRLGNGGLEEAWLRSLLTAWIARTSATHHNGGPVALDDSTREQLEALGYSVGNPSTG